MGKNVLVVVQGAGTEIDARQISINCRLEGGCVQLLDQFNPLLLGVVLWVRPLLLDPLPDLVPFLLSTFQGELTAPPIWLNQVNTAATLLTTGTQAKDDWLNGLCYLESLLHCQVRDANYLSAETTERDQEISDARSRITILLQKIT